MQVAGSAFDQNAYCKVDNLVVNPVIINSTLMLCETPPHKPIVNASFELEFSGGVYITS